MQSLMLIFKRISFSVFFSNSDSHAMLLLVMRAIFSKMKFSQNAPTFLRSLKGMSRELRKKSDIFRNTLISSFIHYVMNYNLRRKFNALKLSSQGTVSIM